MAISDTQKVDLLYKKIGWAVAKTDTNPPKEAYNESNPSPLLIRGDTLWQLSGSIPTELSPTAISTSLVAVYKDTPGAWTTTVECTELAVTDNRTWSTGLTDWISPEFGSTYFVKVYIANSGVTNAQTSGTALQAAGVNDDQWYFDYQAGILNFIGTNLPTGIATGITGKSIYISGARYIGPKGVSAFPNGLTLGNITFNGNTISSSSGNVFIDSNLTISGSSISIGSTNLSITDPIINLHTLSDLTVLTGNDLADIGIKFHYFDTVDSAAFLGRANDTGFLEWYARGTDTANVFVGTAYGTFKTGNVWVANATVSSSTTTGALVVAGGAGIAGNVFVGNILTNGYYYANGNPFTSYTNSDVAAYLPTYTGNIAAGNIIVTSEIHANTITTISNGVMVINSTSAIKVPTGTTVQRPSGAAGELRFNTDIPTLEYFAGSSWIPITNTITDQQITPDGSTNVFTLDQESNTIGAIVSINGTLQQPTVAYTISGDQITFTEVPQLTDLIDIRFLGAMISINSTLTDDLVVSGNLTVNGNIVNTNNLYTYGNTQVAAYLVANPQGSTYSNANVKSYLTQFDGNIVPGANVTYSLGSSTNQWKDLWVSNNTIYIGNTPITVSNGTLLINNSPITSGSTYSNTNVAAYLTTDATVTTLQANLGVTQTWANANIASINANIGGFYSWANTNFGTSSYSNTNANALLSSNTISTINTTGNIKTIANVIGTTFMFANGVNILSTVSSTYSNTNVAAYLTTATISTTGNITGANVISANTISATNFVYSANGISILTGIGGTYSNTNVAAYLTTDSTVTALQANLGVTQLWANANIATINANLGSYQIWSNANAATQQTSITSLATGANTNTAAYLAAGISTNVTTTGNISAGNVLINGALTSYGVVNPAFIVVGLTSSVTSFGNSSTFVLDTVVGNVNSQTSYNTSTGVFTLTAGVTYDMSFTPSFITFSNTTGGYLCYEWVDATTNARLDSTGTGIGTAIPTTESGGQIDNPTARVIYTPSTNQTVKLYVTSASGTATLRGGIGTQAIVRPLNLSVAVQATATGTINNQYASITNGTDISITNGVAKDVTFDTVTASSGIPYNTSTGVFTLTSGVTYRFTGELSFAGYTGYALYQLVDATTNTPINGQIATCPSYNSGFTEANNNTYDAIYTPSTNQTVKFRVTGSNFTGTGVIRGGYFGRINVQQINNAFALNALDTISTTGNVSVGGNLTVTGNLVQQTAYYETYGNVSNTGGNLTCNFNLGTTFYAALTANVTANFTNVNAVSSTVTGATIIVDQGATAYRVANVQVNGVNQTVKWVGATTGTGTASNTDVMSFSLIHLGSGTYRVLGQISNYA